MAQDSSSLRDAVLEIKSTQASFNREIEQRFQQLIKDDFDHTVALKDVHLDMMDYQCKTDKRLGSIETKLAVIESNCINEKQNQQRDAEQLKADFKVAHKRIDEVMVRTNSIEASLRMEIEDGDKESRAQARRTVEWVAGLVGTASIIIGALIGLFLH